MGHKQRTMMIKTIEGHEEDKGKLVSVRRLRKLKGLKRGLKRLVARLILSNVPEACLFKILTA